MVSCTVCNENIGKYKCPLCRAEYCSVVCCKKHKEENCKQTNDLETKNGDVIIDTEQIPQQQQTKFVTEDTVPKELLERLHESKKLKDLLNITDLQKLLKAVDKSTNPNKDVQIAMRDPLFTEFVDECLKIVEPLNDRSEVDF